jgi:hypothetical protein
MTLGTQPCGDKPRSPIQTRSLSGMWSSYHINLHLTSQFLLVHQLESLEAVGINSNFSIMTNITYRFLSDSDDTGLRFVTPVIDV